MSRFETVVLNPSVALEKIAAMNESGARLIANYKREFPDLYKKAAATRFEGEALPDPFGAWAAAAVILGLYDGCDGREAARQLEATALEFQGKSGPRIDYKVDNTADGYRFDPLKCIRSAMSFKLAGVDVFLISFGFIDSLADFIADEAKRADANIGIEGVCLSGDLFENRQLLARTIRAIEKNYPLYLNKRTGMDRSNIVAGALHLGR
jgi:hydrogenase maturation factor HypF (carbamoyltransferase family)